MLAHVVCLGYKCDYSVTKSTLASFDLFVKRFLCRLSKTCLRLYLRFAHHRDAVIVTLFSFVLTFSFHLFCGANVSR